MQRQVRVLKESRVYGRGSQKGVRRTLWCVEEIGTDVGGGHQNGEGGENHSVDRLSCQSSHVPKTHSKAPSYLLLNSRCPTRPSLIGETPAYNYPSLMSYLNGKNLL